MVLAGGNSAVLKVGQGEEVKDFLPKRIELAGGDDVSRIWGFGAGPVDRNQNGIAASRHGLRKVTLALEGRRHSEFLQAARVALVTVLIVEEEKDLVLELPPERDGAPDAAAANGIAIDRLCNPVLVI